MDRYYPRYDGAKSLSPTDKDTAISHRKARYDVNQADGCPACVDFQLGTREGHLRFTKNDRCVLCADMDARDFFGLITRQVTLVPTAPTPTVRATSRNLKRHRVIGEMGVIQYLEALPLLLGEGVFETVPIEFWPDVPTSPSAAAASHTEYYVRSEKCRDCGAIGLRHSDDGKCYFCEKAKRVLSARQSAVAAGERWYLPDSDCVRCGTRSERRVSDGRCKGCSTADATPDARQTPDSLMMEANPEMIISKADAGAYGFKVFRTGKPCTKGHTGWRYVSTGGCIDCLRG